MLPRKSSNLVTRIISALVAVTVVVGTYLIFENIGLLIFLITAATIGLFEYTSVAFKKTEATPLFKIIFFAFCFFLISTAYFFNHFFLEIWSVLYILFISINLWTLRNRINNEKILSLFTISSLGFIYCTILPTLMIKTLFLPQGSIWLLTLLLVVFAGDTFAYFGGKWLGHQKLMPSLSPQKTVAGSVLGLVGSGLAGLVIHFTLLESYPLLFLIPASLLSGITAQSGDLFMSLVKRIADVKDSGNIMPGHGGLLDRADGVYFAAPIIFAAAKLTQHWFY